ncbi:hypothetical protein E2R51_15550 [Jeotgalibacillus sp. S-D1]|uniref:hypothetical protein n=1 Tax=Jeotgalibacillus sp. S-D1 TaxID=2552189 RepID=UPI001059F3B9|nr:hypothetical protein [Jeotgalibacillus sp. S-D1]TDL31198.1 hypothetical protein E2R51_15550 [Jeotgalibacillus sp. S-D1]
MYSRFLEEPLIGNVEIKLMTAALYEAKVKDDEILRVLMKVCDIDRERAMIAFQNEKFIYSPCEKLYQYLILEKGLDAYNANVFVRKHARAKLARNVELSKLSAAKLFDAIYKANK